MRNFLKVGFFYFSNPESYFLKYNTKKFHFQKHRKVPFCKTWESALDSYFLQNFPSKMFGKVLNNQCHGCEYVRVLNMLLGLNMLRFLIYHNIKYQNLKSIYFLKYKKVPSLEIQISFQGFRFLKYKKFS